ncbi:MAG: isoprenyl transferase [Clostridiales bacterium]|nr:isoprenyl transferase [Clostridiales bacterium]
MSTKNDTTSDYSKLPKHIAIIMDGNGRWAQKKGLPRILGHKAGVEAIRDIIITASDIGISFLTVYAFSTENWKRPEEEVKGLFKLLIVYLEKEIEEIYKNNVKLNIIGDYKKLPQGILDKIEYALNYTKNNTGLVFNIALNYGGRDEILKVVREIYRMTKENKIENEEEIDYNLIEHLLYTNGIPDPDLIIRTSGELRLSNFLLWQSAYSEFWCTDTLWPDFKKEDLIKAIEAYQTRERRYGGILMEESK